MVNFFLRNNFFFFMVVAICDLMHDVENIRDLCLRNSSALAVIC